MRGTTKLLIVAALLAAVLAPAAQAKTAAELLREGLYVEEVEGDLDKAVGIYQQVIEDTSAPKNLVAQALYRQGSIYLKQKREMDAKTVFTKLVDNYSDQTEMVEKVKPLLDELGNSDPAGLMPPETIFYVEIGSPGQQVETIFKMLKDTPVEEAMANLNKGSGWEGGGPAAIIRGLLNPSMLAEFKKIRGIGIGIMDITQENPPAMIVLYPGKSDALMGVLRMALSSFGQAAPAVDGMSVVTCAEGAATIAFDDTVVIASSRPEMLQQAILRHKGKLGQPSLASANKSFTSISKQARQQNAVTVWVNVDETYGRLLKVFPADDIPEEVQVANGFVDFQNVEDFLASLSLRETGVGLDANMNFKDGSKSMFYNLIRTPNLNKDVLKAIPAQAVALISLTLGGADSAQAQAIGAKIQEATGQDLGSQIFGNIEQITLFVAPPQETVTTQDWPMPPVFRSLGLAVTCKNPEQAHQLLGTLLLMSQALPQGTQEAPAIPSAGKFDVALANNMKVCGYTDQASKTLVLAIDPQIVDTSIAAMKQNSSVVSGGKLQDALATLSPATSKLVLINAAGAIRIASQNAPFPSDEVAAEARPLLEELAKAAEKTTLRLQTTELDNSFSVRLSVSDLPSLSQIVGPCTRLAQIMESAHGGAWESSIPAGKAVCIVRTSRAPEIDGKADDLWADVESNKIANVAYSPASDETDFSAGFKAMYDNEAFYLLVDVADEELVNDSDEFWLDDTVEVFLDADNSKSDSYEDNDYQYNFSWDSSSPTMGETKHDKTEGVKYAFAKTDAGYRLEVRLPWSTVGADPQTTSQIGLDVHVNDDDDGGDRDTKLMWCTTDDNAWQNPAALGTGELARLVAWWKLDEKEGRTAADSSGNGYDATVQGDPDWQPSGGKVGGAIALGGDGDFLDNDDESAFDFMGGVTVAAWIKVNAFDKPWQAIVTKGDTAWRIQRNNETSTLEFACSGLNVASGSQYGSLYGTRDIRQGEWLHTAGVYDGKRMFLYVDGEIDASQEASGVIGQNDSSLQIGSNTEMGDRFFNGLIDDVRVYNYGLPEAQVKELYKTR
ncbi:MAG: sugar-binding protein [Phycisphaerales bacterium]